MAGVHAGRKLVENYNISRVLAVITSIEVLLLLFASYRARGFHYCAEEEEFQARVVSSDEPCGPDERPLDWNRLGPSNDWVRSAKKYAGTIIGPCQPHRTVPPLPFAVPGRKTRGSALGSALTLFTR
jgi:hypothetical protein